MILDTENHNSKSLHRTQEESIALIFTFTFTRLNIKQFETHSYKHVIFSLIKVHLRDQTYHSFIYSFIHSFNTFV